MISEAEIKKTLHRLAECAANTPGAIAFIGVGSAGLEIERMDAFSDIDFFLICIPERQQEIIHDNSWFGQTLGIDFEFRDTDHGNKVLLSNGVFLEFAIFTESNLRQYGVPGMRLLWGGPEFTLPHIGLRDVLTSEKTEPMFYVNQALANLYVGSLRFQRGELLAAQKMIETFALTNALKALRLRDDLPVQDSYNIERRAESTFDLDFSALLCGYRNLDQSASAILQLLKSNFLCSEPMVSAIEARLEN